MLIPVPLPHLLCEEHFVDGRSLTEWMETWLSGFDDDEVDELYAEAEAMSMEMGAEGTLGEAEQMLTASQRLLIWRRLIAYN